jgi:protocatechuate 3,4-dioxygenase alpha subunit
MSCPRTPSQTIGPFFGFALSSPEGPYVVPEGTPGAIRISGRLLDGGGEPVGDGLIETWQADPAGGLSRTGGSPVFRGFGRCATDRQGGYHILTLKPGAVRDESGVLHAPHLLVSVFARGLLRRAVTRIYFADEHARNEVDPVLSRIGEPALQATLLATATDQGYRFDIRLQGEGETVFFDV